MKIGIIGAGNIGATAARLFVGAGHEVAISNSRGPETLRDLVAELGSQAQAVSVEGAAKFGEVVLISIPFGKFKELPAYAFNGKIVIDSNNYYSQRDGTFIDLEKGNTTSSQLLSDYLHGARVVKGFNTIWVEHLKSQGNTTLPPGERRAIFIAGDDAEAKKLVARLIDDIGFAAVDTGSLREGGKRQQPGTQVYNKTLTAREAVRILNGASDK
jgi:8-hydroxy-5-deazaflavin:NADPH oxidoreductase